MKLSTVSTVLFLATAIALANAKAIDKRDDIIADYAAVEQQEGVATLLKRLVDTAIGTTEEAPHIEDLTIAPTTISPVDENTAETVKRDEDEEANDVDVFVADSAFCAALAADSLMTPEQATAQQAAIIQANAIAEAEEENDGADYDYDDEGEYEDEDEDEDYYDDEDEDGDYYDDEDEDEDADDYDYDDEDEYEDDYDYEDEDEYEDETDEADEDEVEFGVEAEEPKFDCEAYKISKDNIRDAAAKATIEKSSGKKK